MKRLAIYLFILFAAVSAAAINPVANGESLNYRVMFKWGLVSKQAGHVNMRVKYTSDGGFTATLTAATEKWADHLYMVRDTLIGNISRTTFEPTLYKKITHEDGTYKYDHITYSRSGKNVVGHCSRTVQKKPKDTPTTTEITLEAEGLTLDMLSSFYYMRSIDYAKMQPGDYRTMTVFSGKRKETLTITYRGEDKIKIDKKEYDSYHITFRFTGNGGKETSDKMEAWISTEPSRIPLKLEGKLPVGKVQCFLIP